MAQIESGQSGVPEDFVVDEIREKMDRVMERHGLESSESDRDASLQEGRPPLIERVLDQPPSL